MKSKSRKDYDFLFPIQTRWADNDMYGHINNVTYYSYFDTAANALLIQHANFNPSTSDFIGLVVESHCQFISELSYPEIIEVGVSIQHIGNASLKYDLAIFKKDQESSSAHGYFVHVFVDRQSRKSISIPQTMRDALKKFHQNISSI